jgi:hypothetical protein
LPAFSQGVLRRFFTISRTQGNREGTSRRRGKRKRNALSLPVVLENDIAEATLTFNL